MDAFIIYLLLFSIIVILGQVFQKSTVPIGLILVIAGMLLSYVPFFPSIKLDSDLVLNVFLPLLIYEICSFSSWRDMKKQMRPIALLSVGHVLFITVLVALVIHAFLPQLGWPLAIVLGAVISPPDDVAIVSIVEKIKIPERIFLILEGEGMFNDAVALTIFKFALAAALSMTFSITDACLNFILIVVGEVVYGFVIGNLLGMIRSKITNITLHQIASFITPFIAYLPVVKLGGTGIIATAIVGFIIGNKYTFSFTPEYRISAFANWPSLASAIQNLIFLLVGLNVHSTINHISYISPETLAWYVGVIAFVVIVGRFIWVYGALIFLPRFLFPSIRKKDPYPPWQYSFVIAWAGIRGGISLAAALAVPSIFKIDGIDTRDLLVFLVFCIILITLVIQGLTLPYVLKKLGIHKVGKSERDKEHISELQASLRVIKEVLKWLTEFKASTNDKTMLSEISLYLNEYHVLKDALQIRISSHDEKSLRVHDEQEELIQSNALLLNLTDVQKEVIMKLWREEKINLRTRNKLMRAIDHQIERHFTI